MKMGEPKTVRPFQVELTVLLAERETDEMNALRLNVGLDQKRR